MRADNFNYGEEAMKTKRSDEQQVNFVEEIIKKSLKDLIEFDIELLENPAQKLHENCINHRLAVYIEKHLKKAGKEYLVDVEYNKSNYLPKKLMIRKGEEENEIRPDIIVHSRTKNTESLENNYLIIEAKKDKDSGYDEEKVKAFMSDEMFCYRFGCVIKYGDLQKNCKVKLFYYPLTGELRPKELHLSE